MDFQETILGETGTSGALLCIGPVQRTSLLDAAVVKVAPHFLTAAPPSSSEVLDT